MVDDFPADIAAIGRIEAIPTILEVICRTTGMGFAAVARVTEDRWIACSVKDDIAFGLKPGDELQVATTICHEIRQTGQPVIIDHVAQDGAWCGHRTPAMYGFQSYISVPITLRDGRFFGTLCAIDPRPNRLDTPEVTGMFRLFADLIAFHLHALEQIETTGADLLAAQRISELREQFIAVLGHDLRNPLTAVTTAAELLSKMSLNARASRMVTVIRGGAARMSHLIDDVMDFARGRLGGGIALDRHVRVQLEPVLRHVIAELQTSFPARRIDATIALDSLVPCDPIRIGQLVSNLLANALTYGEAGTPIRVRAVADEGALVVSVANGGDPIPPEVMERIFQPFSRGDIRPNRQGLGLGLFIAAEIARAHGGTLDVASSADGTCFTFRMAMAQP